MIAWLLHHWIPFAGVGVLLLAVLFPAISVPVARFLIGTERGRYLLAVLFAVGVFLWYRDHRWNVGYAAAMAEQARKAASAHVDVAEAAVKRDQQGDIATDTATASANARQTDHTKRAERVEGYAHESRPPVPAVCPEPDPRVVRELREGAARVSTTEDRLRSLGRPAREATRPAGADR